MFRFISNYFMEKVFHISHSQDIQKKEKIGLTLRTFKIISVFFSLLCIIINKVF